jgi:PAS domain S-box-containing protein
MVTSKILLVDNNLEDRKTYRHYLLQQQQIYSILEASTGEEAVSLCLSQFPNVIVLDYHLPDMNGLELLENLKTQFGKTFPPVIMLTGQGNEQIAVQAMKSGTADYLVKKDTTRLSFLAAIENVLETTRQTMLLKESEAQQQLVEQREHQLTLLALRESEARFERLAMNIHGVIYQYVLHPDGFDEFTYISPGSRNIYELEPEELLKDFRAVWAMIHPDDVEAVQKANAHSMHTLEAFDLEFRLIPPSGRIKWVHAKSNPQQQENGDLIFDGLIMDISHRKISEAGLRQSEEKYKSLFNSIDEGYVLVDVIFDIDSQPIDLLYVDANPAAVKMTGTELVGRRTRELDPNFEAQWFEVCGRVSKTGIGERQEFYAAPLQAWYNFYAFKVGEPSSSQVAIIYQDVTERKRSEIERKQAQEKIREQAALLDVATDAIFVRDLENRILYWNQSAENLYGWTASESLGKQAHKILYRESLSEIEVGLETAISKGSWQGELEQVTKIGKKIIVASRWTLVRDEFGKPQSILVVNTDITEKKQLEQQFYQTQRLESLGILASGIAHDLNNILTPILAVAQLLHLKLPHLEPQNQQLLKILEDSSKRGAELVKQITAFARGGEGKHIPLQIRHLIKEIRQIAKSTFSKSIEISIDTTTPNLWTVLADPTQIHQVLMNLCVNARDAMPQGGTLTLTAENIHVDENYALMNLQAKVGDYVVVTVSDTGCGMQQEVKERIFEPFFTTKEIGKGTGLGLSTVIGIIKNHDGFINVHSEVGKGSQFQVFLRAMEASVTKQADNSEMALGNEELILVVDDEAFVRDIAKTLLEDLNYRVLIASDAIEAFSLYAQHQNEISVVLMDIQMPSIDGFQAIHILQQMNPTVKIIVTSGLLSNQQLLEANNINVQAFLPKPYTIEELLGPIKRVLTESNN